MFRAIFGRRGVDAAPHPGPAQPVPAPRAAPAAPLPPLHPVLRQMLAEAQALGAGFRGSADQVGRITAPLAAASPAECVRIGHDAFVRLPQVSFSYYTLSADAQARALLIAVDRFADLIAPAYTAPVAVPPLSPTEMAGICRAAGDLFAREWERISDWPRSVVRLMEALLAPERCPRGAEVDSALHHLLVRIGYAPPIREYRVPIAERIVALLGVPRSASPTLAAQDEDFARRAEMRRRIADAAGPALAPFIDALLDTRGKVHEVSPRDFGAAPEVQAVLAYDPATLGGALTTMLRILRDFPKPAFDDWKWLTRDRGAFLAQPHHLPNVIQAFDRLSGQILRKKIEISDAAMAELVRRSVDYNEAAGHPAFQTRHFLNQALKVAASADGAQTRAALAWLLAYRPDPNVRRVGRAPEMPADWKHPIEQALGKAAVATAAAAPLEPPVIDYGRGDNDEKLLAHFRTLFDPRLHDDAHARFLAGIEAAGRADMDRIDAAQVRGFLARWNDARLPTAERLAAHGRASYLDRERREIILTQLVAHRDAIAAHLAAVRPFVERHPKAADRLAGLCHALLNKSAPPQKWLDDAAGLLAPVPAEERLALLDAMIAAAEATPAGSAFDAGHNLRGILYCAHAWDPAAAAPRLADFARRHCYASVPGAGIRDEKLGNACLWALIHMPQGAGVPYLARLLARVKYPKIRAKIDAALNEAAEKAGVTRGALDELMVPTHDLDPRGTATFAVGGGRATLRIAGKSAEIEWLSPEGRPLKAASAAMKADKEALKAVKAVQKEVEADLAAQAVRLQRLYLDDRSWPLADWQARYRDHPLMRGLAARLLWWLDHGDGTPATAILPGRDTLADVSGHPVTAGEGARIRLWHPIDADPAEVLAWRDRIEALALVQPFAQAWREIYRVTDAERATGAYTNRWAGHILRQHQAMTLARLNGWTVTHRMCVDAPNDEPWHLTLPAHNLVADYWVAGAGGDTPEVLDSGAYVYVATDRVAFSRIAGGAAAKDSARGPARAAPLALGELPPIVFSEVMRHCDLFTGVASIASDPAWIDGGGEAEHPNQWRRDAQRYWERQSFGDLTEGAKTRHALLERIVPRLAIADRLALDDNSLTVRGIRHTYRIHLGSAAIQIVGQSRHLCIVPAPSDAARPDYYVPFEGDRTLSLILSKAVLLSADDKVTDPVILRQL